jgi:hypothetical protein
MKTKKRILVVAGFILRLTMAVLLLASAAASVRAEGLSSGEIASERNLRRVLKYLWPALRANGRGGSIYFSTKCHAKGATLPFPQVEVQPPSQGKTGLAAIREIFNKDKNVKVIRDQSGMTRITIGKPQGGVLQTTTGKPQHALLQTRIYSLKLDRDEQYTPWVAVLAITKSREFESALSKVKLGYPLTTFSGGVNEPEKGQPHLPGYLKDMTLEQALDLVAKTFGCIILYGACEEESGGGFVIFNVVQAGEFDETSK